MKKPFKIISVFGTRPDAIKMAPLVMELASAAAASGGNIVAKVAVTAQHREMLDQALEIFSIKPDFDLNLMSGNQGLEELTARILTSAAPLFASEKPDLVLVHGDTATAMAAALAAFYNKIPVGHIEAGLRTENIYSPYPEEINRRLCGVLASFHFAPTALARQNLLRENVADKNIFVTGNTIVDSLKYILEKKAVDIRSPRIKEAMASGKKIIAVTAHRRENFGGPLESMCDAFLRIVRENGDAVIVYPVHLNPNVKSVVEKKIAGHERIILEAPMQYLEFVTLMNSSFFILTDSGGIQEEAVTLKKPVLVMRDVTERPEIIQCGCGLLVGSGTGRITEAANRLFGSAAEYEKMSKGSDCFGDGRAASAIVNAVKNIFGI